MGSRVTIAPRVWRQWRGNFAAEPQADYAGIRGSDPAQRPAPRPSSPFLFESARRFSPKMLCLAITAFGSLSTTARAQDESFEEARLNVRRELELARIEFRDYWQVEYPRIKRDLDARIDLTEEEIHVYRERLRMYDPF